MRVRLRCVGGVGRVKAKVCVTMPPSRPVQSAPRCGSTGTRITMIFNGSVILRDPMLPAAQGGLTRERAEPIQ